MNVSSSMFLDPVGPFRGGSPTGESNPLMGIPGSEDVGQQFESLFVSMLIKEMRVSGSEDGMFAGDSADVYGGLFDTFLGQHIASQGSLGIADMINRQILPKSATPPESTTQPAPASAEASAPGSISER